MLFTVDLSEQVSNREDHVIIFIYFINKTTSNYAGITYNTAVYHALTHFCSLNLILIIGRERA